MLPEQGLSADHGPPVLMSRLHEMDRRHRRRVVAVAIARAVGSTAALLLLYSVLPVHAGSTGELGLRIGIGVLLMAAVIGWQLVAVNRAELPQLRALEALAVTVSAIVVGFAIAYLNMSDYEPAAFNEALGRTSSLYFTLTTLTTIGYGDIAAKTDSARTVVMIQMVVNVVVIGAGVRMILQLARYRVHSPRQGPGVPPSGEAEAAEDG